MFNLLLPLITYPYLIRILGKDLFGLVSFSQAIIGYLVILVSFGFNLSATKEISINRNNLSRLSEIVSSVMIIKLGLFFASFLVLFILVHFIGETRHYEILFYLTMWMCLYDLILPTWYFQGIEKMKYITILTLISRMVFLILIFLIVRKPEDYILVPLFYGIGIIPSGLISFFIIRKHKILLRLQPLIVIKRYLSDSFPIFVSNFSTTLYLNTNKVLVGIFMGMNEVAFYELADKISMVLKTPIQLIGQSIFPNIAHEKNRKTLKKSFIISILLAVTIMIAGLLFGTAIIRLAGGPGMMNSLRIFYILLITIIPVTISMFYANIVLIIWNYGKEFLKLRLFANGLYLICIGFLVITNRINVESLSVVLVLVEIFVAVFSMIQCSVRNINFLVKEY